jgi:tRNA dimethylallyltransferase
VPSGLREPSREEGPPPAHQPRADLAIVGATATGKTALALDIACRVSRTELVSVDSMAVYRGLDIGTEKPAERANWHLIDIADPSEDFSVAAFQAAARKALAGIRSRGNTPIFVGGTGLYHRAVLDGLELPGRYPDVAALLEVEAATPEGLAGLYARLAEDDPVAAGRIEPGNRRRIVRALEVTIGSGRGFSTFGPGLESYAAAGPRLAGLALDRAELDRRLVQRLDDELASGWLDEVARLATRQPALSRTARQAIGYSELLAHVGGELSLEGAKAMIVRRLKSFARRQESWFRRDPRVVWFDARLGDLAERVTEWWLGDMADSPPRRETGR